MLKNLPVFHGPSGRLGSAEQSKMALSRQLLGHRRKPEARHGKVVRKHVQAFHPDTGLVSVTALKVVFTGRVSKKYSVKKAFVTSLYCSLGSIHTLVGGLVCKQSFCYKTSQYFD